MPITTISTLKYQLGEGAGLRSNKFLVEVGSNVINQEKFNVLCKSIAFPARQIDSTSISYHGRKMKVRQETNYGENITLTVVDDSVFSVRRMFDRWAHFIDNSFINAIIQNHSGSSGESADILLTPVTEYFSEVNIWQLSQTGEKVYGYKLNYAFPTEIGDIQYDDSSTNELVSYSVTLTFSDFIPLVG